MSDISKPRVVVVADDPLARAGLATLLSEHGESTVVGQTASENDMSAIVEAFNPEVLVWDLGSDSVKTLETSLPLSELGPPVLALLAVTSAAQEAWRAGAKGLLLRDSDVSAISSAINALALGEVVLDHDIAEGLIPMHDAPPARPEEDLTPRELEVLRLIAEGLPNKVIADQLGISDHTVKFHINSILGKLGAESRTEAVVLASRLGLIVI